MRTVRRRVVGVDGCRGGWFAAVGDAGGALLEGRFYARFDELAAAFPEAVLIAVDIPIGLTDEGPRDADLLARARLAPRRGPSVFPAPLRPMLAADSYRAACHIRAGIDGKGISQQAWHLVPKVREVDDALRADAGLAARVCEVHPELSFTLLAGEPCRQAKRTADGRAERLALLTAVYGELPAKLLADRRRNLVAPDDVLDACVAFWSAGRIVEGRALALPSRAVRDRVGLPMIIRG